MKALTKTEDRVYNYIKRKIELNGYPPTLKQICYDFSLDSRYVRRIIDAIALKGYLIKFPTGTLNLKLGIENELFT